MQSGWRKKLLQTDQLVQAQAGLRSIHKPLPRATLPTTTIPLGPATAHKDGKGISHIYELHEREGFVIDHAAGFI